MGETQRNPNRRSVQAHRGIPFLSIGPSPASQVRQSRAPERRRCIQRLRPLQANPKFRRKILKRDVHVVQNLDMVAKKPNRLQAAVSSPLACNRCEGLLHRRPNPRTAACALTLEGKPPLRNLGDALGHELRRAPRLLRIRICALARPQPRSDGFPSATSGG